MVQLLIRFENYYKENSPFGESLYFLVQFQPGLSQCPLSKVKRVARRAKDLYSDDTPTVRFAALNHHPAPNILFYATIGNKFYLSSTF